MSLAFQRNVRPPIVLEKAHVTLQSWHPSGCRLYKTDPRPFCNYLFQIKCPESAERLLRCNSSAYYNKLLEYFLLWQYSKSLSLKKHCGIRSKHQGPLLNFLKYCKCRKHVWLQKSFAFHSSTFPFLWMCKTDVPVSLQTILVIKPNAQTTKYISLKKQEQL